MTVLDHECRDHLIVVPWSPEDGGRPENEYRCTVCHRRLTAGEVFLKPTDALMRKEAT